MYNLVYGHILNGFILFGFFIGYFAWEPLTKVFALNSHNLVDHENFYKKGQSMFPMTQ